MYLHETNKKCRVLKSITDKGNFYCLKPATVLLSSHVSDGSEVISVCLDCARDLAKEILDSVPNGRLDLRKRGR